MGDAVPIVRCDQHEVKAQKVHLNLTFDGDVFVSGVIWEEAFRDVLATALPDDARPGLLEREADSGTGASPSAGATPAQLDLGPVATALPGRPVAGRDE